MHTDMRYFYNLNKFIFFIIFLWNTIRISCYKEALVEFKKLSNGFALSIPNDPEIQHVLFIIEINEQCPAYVDSVEQPKHIEGGRMMWMTDQSDRELEDGDILAIAILIQHNNGILKIRANHKVNIGTQQTILSVFDRNDFGSLDHCDTKLLSEDCEKSETVTANTVTNVICRGQSLFQEVFSNERSIDERYWSYDTNDHDNDIDEEFVLFNRSNVFLEDGTLLIVPTLNTQNIRIGHVKLSECSVGGNCTVEGNYRHWKFLPPIISGQINMKNSLKFKYGRVRIRAKMPIGDWIYPHIRLRSENMEDPMIIMAFAHGNSELIDQDSKQDISGRRMNYGVVKWKSTNSTNGRMYRWPLRRMESKTNSEHYGNGFHEYVLTWTKNSISLSIDGEKLTEIPESITNECFLELGVLAGGHWVFPENVVNKNDQKVKPWKNLSPKAVFDYWNQRSIWMKNDIWNQLNRPHALQITHIEINAL